MTFDDFKLQYDKYLAYSSWMTIHDAKLKGLLPGKYHEFFPDTCECGSDIIISHNLHRCMCCNPRCYIKEACRLAEFLKNSGVGGFGEKNCMKILDAFFREDQRLRKDPSQKPLFELGRYVEVLGIPFAAYPLELQQLSIGYEFYQACQKILTTPITFPQLISKLGIASIGSGALDLFHGINSFDELVSTIKASGGVQMYCEGRGSHSWELMDSLYDSILDIGIAAKLLCNTIRKEGIQPVNICITGHICLNGQGMVKASFINVLNHLCTDKNGVPLYEFRNTAAIQSAPFIVYSTPSNSAKFIEGKNRGRTTDIFGTHDVLITADDLYQLLKSMMEKWNESLDMDERFSGISAGATAQKIGVF